MKYKMNLDKLNQFLTLLANLGVIAGIVFLAMEVQQNTSMMEAQTRDAMTDKLINWQLSLATDLYTSQTFVTGNAGELLDNSAQENSYLMLISSNLRIWENEWYQYSKGLYEEDEFTPRINRWKGIMQGEGDGYRRIWCLRKDSFSTDFQSVIDSWVQDVGGCE
jgi:hypothetical protein|tara:strand:- start:196 stop:687 length:492 start_codon:yes stop_codon:yes gene_type:complete